MPITPQEALQRTIEHREIFHDEMLHIMRMIMKGELSPVMTAALLTGLRVKKETIGEITAADLTSVQQMLQGLINDPKLLAQYFGSYITHAKHELDATEPDPHYHLDEIAEYLLEGSVLARLGGLRCCYIQRSPNDDILLFINGNTINLPATELSTVKQLCEQVQLDQATAASFADNPAKLQLLTMLINLGYWYFIE